VATLHTAPTQPRSLDAALSPCAPSEFPPVVILNMFYSGLGIARDMAGRGVRTVGLSADRNIYGNFSRFCEVRLSPNSQEEPERLAAMLLQLVPELGGAVIFPTRDADVLFLDRFRADLEPHYRLALPSHDCLMRVMDKYALVTIARKAGISAPRTVLVSSSADLPRAEVEVGFPCVVKPVFAVNWRGGEAWNKVGARKAIRVNNRQELKQEYDLVSGIDPEVLVQEWIPGAADQIVVLGGYVGDAGELLEYFTARKLVQSPDDFGTGCLVESDEIQEIVNLSKRLCKVLGYRGMAEIEYKYNKGSGEFQLIEINTRHWDWHRLGSASGINLTWVAYCDLTGRAPEVAQKPIVRAKWVAEDALLMYCLRALYHRQIHFRDLWHKLSGRKVYGVFAWNDPLPWLRYCFFVLLPDLASSIFKRIGGGLGS